MSLIFRNPRVLLAVGLLYLGGSVAAATYFNLPQKKEDPVPVEPQQLNELSATTREQAISEAVRTGKKQYTYSTKLSPHLQ
jgi:hypothetical protein